MDCEKVGESTTGCQEAVQQWEGRVIDVEDGVVLLELRDTSGAIYDGVFRSEMFPQEAAPGALFIISKQVTAEGKDYTITPLTLPPPTESDLQEAREWAREIKGLGGTR